jgi:hypothetical protein
MQDVLHSLIYVYMFGPFRYRHHVVPVSRYIYSHYHHYHDQHDHLDHLYYPDHHHYHEHPW